MNPIEIVKLQAPLNSGNDGICVIYDSRRERQQFIHRNNLPDDARKAIDGNKKCYFNATWRDGSWTLAERVSDQPW